jgi:hypothetical protein
MTVPLSYKSRCTICAVALPLSACCNSYRAELHVLPLMKRNPTSIVLPSSPDDVVACWRKFDPGWGQRFRIRTSAEEAKIGVLVASVRANADVPREQWSPDTGPYDAHVSMLAYVTQQEIYSEAYVDEDGNYLPYSADFMVHVAPVPGRGTLVTVKTTYSAVLLGTTFSWHVFGCVWGLEQDVPPSTIDEYRIILRLAECLGVAKDMPPPVLPKRQGTLPKT